MTGEARRWDLIVLTADKNTHFALEGLLSRPEALGIRPFQENVRILVHPRRDPAVRRESHSFLRPFLRQASYCLSVFDREGSGGEDRPREELERTVQANLDANGWEGRSSVVVIDPELEVWVWANCPQVDAVLGWPSRGRNLGEWLADRGFQSGAGGKPAQPKAAVEAALRESGTSRSSALYRDLARQVDFRRCADPAFAKLRNTLAAWFPADVRR